MTVLMPTKVSSLKQGGLIGSEAEQASSDSIYKVFVLIGNMFGLFLLLTLFVLSLVVWVWIASFRSGWQFWDWAKEKKNEAISTSLFYGLIILMASPIVIFFDWAQGILHRFGWNTIPENVPLRDYLEKQLKIDLGESFPFSPKPEVDKTVNEANVLVESGTKVEA